jgi:diacylglycerol kinase (ATP)
VERRIGVLINPTSGKGRVSNHAGEVLRALSARGDHVVAIQGDSAAHARQLLDAAVAEGLDALVAVGGDGTVHLALQAVVGSGTALGIVPLGTGNDAATALGVPTTSAQAAVDVILAGNARTFDVGHVVTADGKSAHFLCVLSTGFDSLVNERANQLTRPSGDARYVVALMAELRRFEPIHYRMVLDGELVEQEAMIVSFGNGTSFGGGMRVCPAADLHDGLLDMITVDRMSRLKLLRLFPSIYPGRHVDQPEVTERPVREAHVEAPGGIAYADGERVGPLPADVTTLAGGVRVLVPR